MNQRLKWMCFSFLLLLTLTLAACSGGKETAKESNESENPSSSDSSQSDEPKYGGTVTVAMPADALTLDPHESATYQVHDRAGLVYNKLVTFKTGPDAAYADATIVPDLAEEWEVSEDGKTYTFHLREAYWHDLPPVNGRKVVAEDVVATMENILNQPGHQLNLLDAVESIEAPDEQTVVFNLKTVFAPFLTNMASHFMWILPKEAIEGQINLAEEAIGTGPFMLEKWDKNIKASYVRNPNYFEEGKPYLDGVDIMIIPDQAARIAAFRTGQIEYMSEISPEDWENLKRTNPDTIENRKLYATQSQLAMGMKHEKFKDERVRQAISMAIDRQNAVDRIYGGGEISAPVNPTMGDWSLPIEEREELLAYDPEKAKQLLADAGFPNGFDTVIMTTEAYGEELVRLAQWVAEDLKAIGINAEIEVAEYGSFIERWRAGDFELKFGYITRYQEVDEWLYYQFHTNGVGNYFGDSYPELDKILEEQRVLLDVDARKAKVHEAQRYILKHVLNPMPIVTQYRTLPIPPYLQAWHEHASYGYIHMKNVWLDK
ncbi:ABC transporter substrate-binding protein [Bacillus dakarensis]|uniref:ABC transporter substrate-binding protein n=1 Tax=Robertmurraya dakarensis TaxID=1926278 RepID=UPI0009826678|nr:ABC transporter substrate-binding protein [Bacillus dakarensis]